MIFVWHNQLRRNFSTFCFSFPPRAAADFVEYLRLTGRERANTSGIEADGAAARHASEMPSENPARRALQSAVA